MRLPVYCNFVYDLVSSRRDVYVDYLNIKVSRGRRKGRIQGLVHFWDSSLLRFEEAVVEHGIVSIVTDYVYHYQSAGGVLLFRYDNSPHYPDLATFPHHKHVGTGSSETVEPAQPPTLAQVLREIDSLLYANSK